MLLGTQTCISQTWSRTSPTRPQYPEFEVGEVYDEGYHVAIIDHGR